ncbi:hypothetical protein CDG81_13775 [Actinopolyspora erythraea]|uniref:Uncharacterized protein n=1 Tax=Actinopolyspora erythraea TaxID=414996 RepID=A0A099D5L7_9ACTN|nr:hypothetical protein [Actinopolyspora erythraea]ASU79181.1 hypothetical protein CDG81_13775 [Actinopolyspora erythraea]KGI80640.1 hypothetical protein IL38_16030 [Actinopolyspora erythraea]
MTTTDLPNHYDPVAVFAETFDDGMLAEHLATLFTCDEVNVLAGLLESFHRHEGARCWLDVHQNDCDEPHRH